MKTVNVTLCGVDFEFCGALDKIGKIGRYRDIYDAYQKPSATKVDIWFDWLKFFVNNFERVDIKVGSRNVFNFTIEALFTYENKHYYAYITSKHNRLYEIV